MSLRDLFDDVSRPVNSDCWDRERTTTPIRAFAVRLRSGERSLRETTAILDLLGVGRSHGRSGNGRTAPQTPRMTCHGVLRGGFAVEETAIQIGTKWRWCYAMINLDSMAVLYIEIFSHRAIDPAAAFLFRLFKTSRSFGDGTLGR